MELVEHQVQQRIFFVLNPEHWPAIAPLMVKSGITTRPRTQYYWLHSLAQLKPGTLSPGRDTVFISHNYLEQRLPNDIANYMQKAVVIYLYDTLPADLQKLIEIGVDDFIAVPGITLERLKFTYETVCSRNNKLNSLQYFQLDEVSGLPGRSGFERQLELRLEQMRASDEGEDKLAVMLVHLRGFNQLSHHYGQPAADQALQCSISRIQKIVGPRVELARAGNEDICFAIDKIYSPVNLSRLALKLIETLSVPIIMGKESAVLGCRIGIAEYAKAGDTASSLLKSADIALKAAIGEPRDSFKFFHAKMEADSRDRYRLEMQLRRAITRQELELFYQPRIDLQQNKVVGVEALVRWNHPEHGLLMPDVFIPLAEESNLIMELGYWTLEQGCRDLLSLQEWGIKDINLAINLSFKQFHDPELSVRVKEIIRRYPINPLQLEFELTETTLLHDQEKVLEAMGEISAEGIRFSLDDFGTGYSSFAHIAELPITLLKVDRSFVNGMETQLVRTEIVNSIIALAHRLNMEVVSEGVDNEQQRRRLVDMNCDQCQGYLFSEPLPFLELCEWLVGPL